MTRDQMLSDLYERLSSRKLWLAVLSIAFGLWNYIDGRLSAVEFQAVVFAAVGVYTAAEGLADAVGAYRPKPSPGDTQTITVGAEAPVAATTPPARKVRPSRARPKGPTP